MQAAPFIWMRIPVFGKCELNGSASDNFLQQSVPEIKELRVETGLAFLSPAQEQDILESSALPSQKEKNMIPVFDFRVLFVGVVFSVGLSGMNHAYANDEVWQKLAQGGKVVLMRHASVRMGPGNGNSLLRDPSCQKERNLSSEGEREARIVGQQFQERNIPVSDVRHSPFCRTADTARIAFAQGAPAAYLSLLEILGAGEAAAQTRALSEVIGGYAGEGNLVLVTHEPNINAVSFEMMKPSDFLVLQPKGGSEFEELGIVRLSGSD